jgi:hypothetical protein
MASAPLRTRELENSNSENRISSVVLLLASRGGEGAPLRTIPERPARRYEIIPAVRRLLTGKRAPQAHAVQEA